MGVMVVPNSAVDDGRTDPQANAIRGNHEGDTEVDVIQ